MMVMMMMDWTEPSTWRISDHAKLRLADDTTMHI